VFGPAFAIESSIGSEWQIVPFSHCSKGGVSRPVQCSKGGAMASAVGCWVARWRKCMHAPVTYLVSERRAVDAFPTSAVAVGEIASLAHETYGRKAGRLAAGCMCSGLHVDAMLQEASQRRVRWVRKLTADAHTHTDTLLAQNWLCEL
jgi:hypothetical protein